ncbi:amidase family protein, partial [Suttonella ornithocola]
MTNLTHKSAAELSRELTQKNISSVELTRLFLDKIAEHNPTLNAFIRTTEEHALTLAAQSDERRAKGETLSPLDGIPMAHKDIFCTAGIITTAASKMLEHFIPPHTATIAENLSHAG